MGEKTELAKQIIGRIDDLRKQDDKLKRKISGVTKKRSALMKEVIDIGHDRRDLRRKISCAEHELIAIVTEDMDGFLECLEGMEARKVKETEDG